MRGKIIKEKKLFKGRNKFLKDSRRKETIQMRKVYKGGHYKRKYGIFTFFGDKKLVVPAGVGYKPLIYLAFSPK